MRDDVRFSNPPGLIDASKLGFSHMSIGRAHQVIHVAGQTAADPEGRYDPADGLADQTRKTLANLGTALHSVDASPSSVVALRVYIVHLERSMFPVVAPEIASFLDGAGPPPATWVGVTSLLSPDAMIEIEAVALIDTP